MVREKTDKLSAVGVCFARATGLWKIFVSCGPRRYPVDVISLTFDTSESKTNSAARSSALKLPRRLRGFGSPAE